MGDIRKLRSSREKLSSIITLRVDDAIKDRLQTESQMKGVTLNSLVNQVLRKYTEWDRFEKDVGFATITKAFLRAILEQLDEKTISTIAVSTCRGALRDATIYINGVLDYSGQSICG